MRRVIVYVKGGVVDVITDDDEVEVRVVDFDAEPGGEDVVQIETDLGTVDALVELAGAEVVDLDAFNVRWQRIQDAAGEYTCSQCGASNFSGISCPECKRVRESEYAG